jgi:uncharacterized protein YkwD
MPTRSHVIALCTLALALLIPTAASASQRALQLSPLETSLLSDLNKTRAHYGLGPLQISPALTAAARQHSQEMARRGYFAHNSADGGTFDKRLARYYPLSARFQRWSVGENLVWRSQLDAAQALRLWMASPEHRRNILTPEWREIGIAATQARSAPGSYGGGPATIITTDFGARR